MPDRETRSHEPVGDVVICGAHQEAFKEETGPGRAAILDRPVSCPNAVRVHHWTICPVPPDFR